MYFGSIIRARNGLTDVGCDLGLLLTVNTEAVLSRGRGPRIHTTYYYELI